MCNRLLDLPCEMQSRDPAWIPQPGEAAQHNRATAGDCIDVYWPRQLEAAIPCNPRARNGSSGSKKARGVES